MASCAHACDNGYMHSTDPDVPPPPAQIGAEQRPGRGVRTFGRGVGWTAAVLAVPFGIALSWLAAWLGNCKWGFFGDVGPAMGAEAFTVNDLGVQSIGWLVAVVPWLIIARWNPDASRRRVGAVVVICVSAVVLIAVMLPQLGGITYWEQVCT